MTIDKCLYILQDVRGEGWAVVSEVHPPEHGSLYNILITQLQPKNNYRNLDRKVPLYVALHTNNSPTANKYQYHYKK